MDSLDFEHADAVNQGLSVRRHMTRQSRVIDTMGRIHGDIFFQERYVLNEVNVKAGSQQRRVLFDGRR